MIPSVNEFMMMVHTFDNMLDYVDVNARENPTDFTYQIVVRNVKTDYSLYDLRRDPGERYDVKELYPNIFEDLKKLADEMRKDLGDENYNLPGADSRRPGFVKN
jgi:arylsulfatase